MEILFPRIKVRGHGGCYWMFNLVPEIGFLDFLPLSQEALAAYHPFLWMVFREEKIELVLNFLVWMMQDEDLSLIRCLFSRPYLGMARAFKDSMEYILLAFDHF